MNKSQLSIIASITAYARALLEIIDKGFTTFAIICLFLGSLMLCLYVKYTTSERK